MSTDSCQTQNVILQVQTIRDRRKRKCLKKSTTLVREERDLGGDVRRPYSDWATGLMTDESWFDCRQGQGVVSAPQNVHTNCGAHSASLQRVPGISPDGATPYHSPPSTVGTHLHSTPPPCVQIARKGENLHFKCKCKCKSY